MTLIIAFLLLKMMGFDMGDDLIAYAGTLGVWVLHVIFHNVT